jgi:hypothetical protein
MVSYGTTSYESFQDASYSSLDPDFGSYGSVGYRLDAGTIGFPGSPQTGNQLGETVNALKHGTKTFEVSLLGVQDADQTIPIQHFKEMRALMKLSGVRPSVHGPLVDAAGFGEQGWGGEHIMEDNQRKMFDAIEKAHILDPKGNVPIVFHSSNGTPGTEWRPGDTSKGEERFKEFQTPVIDQESGRVTQVKEHRSYYMSSTPEEFKLGEKDIEKGGKLMTTRAAINNQNETEWDEKIKEITLGKRYADQALQDALGRADALDLTNIKSKGEFERELKGHPEIVREFTKAATLLDNSNVSFRSLFNRAYKYGSNDQRKELRGMASDFQKASEDDKDINNDFQKQIKESQLQDEFLGRLKGITSPRGKLVNGKKLMDENYGAPKVHMAVEDFAMDKAAQTFGEIASKSYGKFGETAPIIAIENMYQGMAFSRGKDMKKLVNKSRKEFAKKLHEDQGLSKGDAKRIAKKQIGVTWDVGHINVMRKSGFEEKDIVKATETIAPMVKHVHLTDNFGYSDSHLLPGMGNVPFKKILETLEKTGRLGEMNKIVEAGGFIQHFKKLPHAMALSAFGSPIYGSKMAPYWNQASDMVGSYFGGYGTLNPQQHHSIYGAGFTTMPVELGGMMPGGQSRFDGAPMS